MIFTPLAATSAYMRLDHEMDVPYHVYRTALWVPVG